MSRNVILLGEVAARIAVLEVRCGRGKRRGRRRFNRPLAQHGPEAPVAAVLRALVADCPHQDGNRCDRFSPELERLLANTPTRVSTR